MARMIPPIPPADLNRGEREVWKWCLELPADWAVINSYKFESREGRARRRREVDFVVVIPKRGIISLEVKGGRIEFRDNEWRQNDEPADPEGQATRAAYNLGRILAAALRKPVPSRFGLAFPDSSHIVAPQHLQDSQVLCAGKGHHNFTDALRRLVETAPDTDGQVDAVTTATTSEIIKVLAPHMSVTLPGFLRGVDEMINASTKQRVRATAAQLNVVAAFEQVPRMCVLGPAGSGKSLLAFNLALEAARSGQRSALISPSGKFLEHLRATRLALDSDIADGLHVLDVTRLADHLESLLPRRERDRISKHRPTIRNQDDQSLFAIWLSELIDRLGTDAHFDNVFVDEAQDFHRDLLTTLAELCGQTGRAVLFADPLQDLLSDGQWKPPAGYEPHRLMLNLRNTEQVARLAYGTVLRHEATKIDFRTAIEYVTKESIKPLFIARDRDVWADTLVASISELLSLGIQHTDIAVILCGPDWEIRSTQARRALGAAGALYDAGDPSHPKHSEHRDAAKSRGEGLLVTHTQDIKGMECSVAVVDLGTSATSGSKSPTHRKHGAEMYVATSRARGLVVVLGTPGQLGSLRGNNRYHGTITDRLSAQGLIAQRDRPDDRPDLVEVVDAGPTD